MTVSSYRIKLYIVKLIIVKLSVLVVVFLELVVFKVLVFELFVLDTAGVIFSNILHTGRQAQSAKVWHILNRKKSIKCCQVG